MSAFPGALQDLWQQWSQRFAALSKRERGIMAATLVLGGGVIIFSLAIEPFQIKARVATKAAAEARAELDRQQTQLAVLSAQNADPDARSRQRLAQARDQRKMLGERLTNFEAGMVPPSRMQAFLEGLLAKNGNIELLELKTLPVEQVGGVTAEKKADSTVAQVAQIARDSARALTAGQSANVPAEGIYQHGVEIRLAGGYNDLLNYVAELEHMPQQVMWNSVKLEVIKYPRNEMTLRVYTLSLDKNWLVL